MEPSMLKSNYITKGKAVDDVAFMRVLILWLMGHLYEFMIDISTYLYIVMDNFMVNFICSISKNMQYIDSKLICWQEFNY